MTITYTAEVATAAFGCFLKLLCRWRGSIYKLMWREFAVYFIAYYALNFVYRFALNDAQKEVYEQIVAYFERHTSLIPIAFVLGFYVTIVVTRWWEQFTMIPWPDRMALFVSANIPGHDERGRLMRRTIMRYLCLSHVIIMSCISTMIKKRFPKFHHMQEAGFLQGNELSILEDIQTPHNKYFVPLVWANAIISRGRKEGRIKDDFAMKTLIDEINNFRGMLGGLLSYDWITIPLVYTQVVTLAVYMFCLSTLMGRQMTDSEVEAGSIDVYIPIFTFLQFFFYMGWLKVAEAMINPFGEDEDDFDLNYMIDRNLQVSYLMVDEMHQQHPQLVRDQYWDEVTFDLPYTAASVQYKQSAVHLGSAMGTEVPKELEEFIPLTPIQESPAPPVSEDNLVQPSSSKTGAHYDASKTGARFAASKSGARYVSEQNVARKRPMNVQGAASSAGVTHRVFSFFRHSGSQTAAQKAGRTGSYNPLPRFIPRSSTSVLTEPITLPRDHITLPRDPLFLPERHFNKPAETNKEETTAAARNQIDIVIAEDSEEPVVEEDPAGTKEETDKEKRSFTLASIPEEPSNNLLWEEHPYHRETDVYGANVSNAAPRGSFTDESDLNDVVISARDYGNIDEDTMELMEWGDTSTDTEGMHFETSDIVVLSKDEKPQSMQAHSSLKMSGRSKLSVINFNDTSRQSRTELAPSVTQEPAEESTVSPSPAVTTNETSSPSTIWLEGLTNSQTDI